LLGLKHNRLIIYCIKKRITQHRMTSGAVLSWFEPKINMPRLA